MKTADVKKIRKKMERRWMQNGLNIRWVLPIQRPLWLCAMARISIKQ